MQKQILISESYEKNQNKYERGKHYVSLLMWHFEWCPKYGYKMFAKTKYRDLAISCIRKAAYEHKIKIIELEVMPEHIHLSAEIPGTMSPSKAIT